MNPRLAALHAYPFERLAKLKAGVAPPPGLRHIAMSIGEPQHAPPEFVLEALRRHLADLGSYPTTVGLSELREACAAWLDAPLPAARGQRGSADHGAAGQRHARSAVRLRAGGGGWRARARPWSCRTRSTRSTRGRRCWPAREPYFMDTVAAGGLPAGPRRGARGGLAALPGADPVQPGQPDRAPCCRWSISARALDLAERYDFIVASDECYADIYLDEAAPPPGLLEAAEASGAQALRALRGVPQPVQALEPAGTALRVRRRRSQADRPLPPVSDLPRQRDAGADAAGQHRGLGDDAHAAANRRLYQEKFARVLPMLRRTDAAGAPRPVRFTCGPRSGGDDEASPASCMRSRTSPCCRAVTSARDAGAGNPGAGRVRISLVPPVAQCVEAAAAHPGFPAQR